MVAEIARRYFESLLCGGGAASRQPGSEIAKGFGSQKSEKV
jgi:hypothetical protein